MSENSDEILKALGAQPLAVKEIKFRKTKATLYRVLQRMEERGWVIHVEGCRYALTEKGRKALELLP